MMPNAPIEALKAEAIQLMKQVTRIVDHIYEQDELEGDMLTEMLTNESLIRS